MTVGARKAGVNRTIEHRLIYIEGRWESTFYPHEIRFVVAHQAIIIGCVLRCKGVEKPCNSEQQTASHQGKEGALDD